MKLGKLTKQHTDLTSLEYLLKLSLFKRTNIIFCFQERTFSQGRRRYDAKQAGYGGQTKPIFRKKVRSN